MLEEILEIEGKVVEMELAADKCRIALEDILEYLSETEDQYLCFFRPVNSIKTAIAFDYFCEIEMKIAALKEQTDLLIEACRKIVPAHDK